MQQVYKINQNDYDKYHIEIVDVSILKRIGRFFTQVFADNQSIEINNLDYFDFLVARNAKLCIPSARYKEWADRDRNYPQTIRDKLLLNTLCLLANRIANQILNER